MNANIKIKIFSLLLSITFLTGNSFGSLIYQKDNLIITDIDVLDFKKANLTFFDNQISENLALKELILLKKLIIKISKNDPELLVYLKNKINTNEVNNLESIKDIDIKYYILILKELINEYKSNEKVIKNLKIIIDEFKNKKISISLNNCFTVDKVMELGEIENIAEIFFVTTYIDKNNKFWLKSSFENSRICLSENDIYQIDSKLNKLLFNKIKKELFNQSYDKK